MPENARVYIIWPPDGEVIHGGFWIRMGLSGAGVAPAGTAKANTGHHHLLVDTDLPPMNEPIPNDKNHLHFGLGQTEARINLPPGKHTLQLLLGNEDHIPYDPPLYSKKITVTVLPGTEQAQTDKPYVYIGWPQDGMTVPTHFKVWFGMRNYGMAPAGVSKVGTGHEHLLVDTDLPPLNEPIPNDHNHLHFGLGQTEAVIDLAPGTHTLQLLMGDPDHIPQNPPIMSKKITIHVVGPRVPPPP